MAAEASTNSHNTPTFILNSEVDRLRGEFEKNKQLQPTRKKSEIQAMQNAQSHPPGGPTESSREYNSYDEGNIDADSHCGKANWEKPTIVTNMSLGLKTAKNVFSPKGTRPESPKYLKDISMARRMFETKHSPKHAGKKIKALNSVPREQLNSLTSAVIDGDIETLRTLVQAGADVNAKDKTGT